MNEYALDVAIESVNHPAVTSDDMEDIVSDAVRAYLDSAGEVMDLDHWMSFPVGTVAVVEYPSGKSEMVVRCGDGMDYTTRALSLLGSMRWEDAYHWSIRISLKYVPEVVD